MRSVVKDRYGCALGVVPWKDGPGAGQESDAETTMKVRLSMLAVSLLPCGLDVPRTAGDDKQLIQGTWVMQAFEADGQKQAGEDVKDYHLTFHGDSYTGTYASDGQWIIATYTIDPGRKPREITMTVRDDSVRVPFLGIYELKGNVLKICFGIPGQRPERPTEMTGSAGTKQVLYVFKRLGTPEQD